MTTVDADKALDDGIRNAADRAHRSPGDCFSVYQDASAVYVRASEAAAPKDAKLIAIAQRWDDTTVQVRFSGGYSEWVKKA